MWRAFHNALPLNSRTFHFSENRNDRCLWCPHAKQTVKHFIVDCEISKHLWSALRLSSLSLHEPSTLKEAFCGRQQTSDVQNCPLLTGWVSAWQIYMTWCFWNR